MLTSKQRANIKALSNSMDAIIQVGKGGISDAIIKQIDDALSKREIIKITVLENAPEFAREISEEIAQRTSSNIVQVIGRKVILYRKAVKPIYNIDTGKKIVIKVKPAKKTFEKEPFKAPYRKAREFKKRDNTNENRSSGRHF